MVENEGNDVPAGTVVAVQVYVRFDAPPASAPSTERTVDVPVTVPGAAVAACATVGAEAEAWIVNGTDAEATPLATTDNA